MPMLTLQFFKFLGSPKLQKSWYFESKALLLIQIKPFIYYKLNPIIWQKYGFLAEVTVLKTFFKK